MKNSMKQVVAIVCGAAIFSLSGCVFLSGCSSTNEVDPRDVFKEKMGIELPYAKKALRHESHGGWFGEGETVLIMTFDEDKGKAVGETLSQAEHWQPAPLDPVTSTLLCSDFNHTVTVPEITEGYYYFYALGVYTPPENYIEDAYSFNFAISAFDSTTNTLYYYQLDT
jgi:hypothetical protein